jgi:cellulase
LTTSVAGPGGVVANPSPSGLTTTTKVAAASSTVVPVSSATPDPEPVPEPEPSGTLTKWSQCGGASWTGSGTCVEGTTCTASSEYYSQCL